MRNKLQQFMIGRYGMDTLNNALMILCIANMLLSMFFHSRIFPLLTLLLIILTYFRMFSKNHTKRRKENEYFLKYFGPIRKWIYQNKRQMQDRKTHHIYRCPNCKQKIRIPKGHGKIIITCPKCRNEFTKKR